MVERHIRVAEEIKKAIYPIINTELKKPIQFFSICHVKLAKDISFAKIYVSFFTKAGEKDLEKINAAKGFIRSRLAKIIKVKKIPELSFVLDESLKIGGDVLDTLNSMDIPKDE